MSKLRFNPFGTGRLDYENAEDVAVSVMPDSPNVIEGVELIDAVMPVNKLTGQRQSVFDFLKLATGAKADLVSKVIAELPVVRSDPNMTDSDRVNMLAMRFASGTPAENERLVQVLSENASVLFGSNPELKESVTEQVDSEVNSIKFDPTENV